MIAGLALLVLLGGAPAAVTVTSAGGDTRVPVRQDRFGAPVLPAPQLLAALGGTIKLSDSWADVTVSRQAFRFLLGAPLYVFSSKVRTLAASATVAGDTLYLPLQFVAEVIPYFLGERYRYDARAARLTDLGAKPLATGRGGPGERLTNGLRPGHIVTVDPGHGGVDPGNPGTYFPRGVKEKHVTLQIGLLLR